MGISTKNQPPTPDKLLLEELRAIRRELAAIRDLLKDFIPLYLDARFPYGRPVDRFASRRPRG